MYGEEFINHPVGTGPYRLAEWRRGSKIVLERNPTYREEFYPSEGEEGDAEKGLLDDAGKPLPLIDRTEITIIEEDQPRTWVASANLLREHVLRDLDWLLNTRRTPVEVPEGLDELDQSLFRYGLPDISSLSATSPETPRALARAIAGSSSPRSTADERVCRRTPPVRPISTSVSPVHSSSISSGATTRTSAGRPITSAMVDTYRLRVTNSLPVRL